ncbi:MAG: hypothetical protein SPK06_06545 [Kiritimatiellia bacterium]|nr:hypothetical protein [Kiritimatiellia bacterium]
MGRFMEGARRRPPQVTSNQHPQPVALQSNRLGKRLFNLPNDAIAYAAGDLSLRLQHQRRRDEHLLHLPRSVRVERLLERREKLIRKRPDHPRQKENQCQNATH